MADALTPIDAALVPAEVRKAGPEAQKLYSSALAFESVLTQQLAQSLTSSLDDSSSSGEDGESTSDAGADVYKQMLPDAFAKGVTGGGGLGLAQQLYASIREQEPKS